MTNTYIINYETKCPNNGDTIQYTLHITSLEKIMAEDIEDAVRFRDSYHEDMADILHQRFGGSQLLTATHGKVKIQTLRGE